MRKQKGRNLKTSKTQKKEIKIERGKKKKREASLCFFLVSIQLQVEKLTCLDGENRSPKRWRRFSSSFSSSSPSSSSSSASLSLSLFLGLFLYILLERERESREALYNFAQNRKKATRTNMSAENKFPVTCLYRIKFGDTRGISNSWPCRTFTHGPKRKGC